MPNEPLPEEAQTPTPQPIQPEPITPLEQPSAIQPESEGVTEAPLQAAVQPQADFQPQSFEQVTPPAPVENELPVQPVISAAEPAEPAAPGTPVAPVVPVVPVAPIGSGPQTLPPPKKKRKGLIIGIIVVAVLALLGTSGALAYNFVYQNPEKVVTDALVNALQAKTVSGTGTIDVKSDDVTVKVSVDGAANEKNGKLAIKLDVLSGKNEFKLDGEGLYAENGDLYVKVNNVDKLLDTYLSGSGVSTTAFDNLVKKVDGNWIKISNSDLGDLSEDYEKTKKCSQDAFDSLSTDKSVSNEISALYNSNKFIVVKDKLGSKTINGVGSLGYTIEGDSDKGKAFFSGLKDTQFGKKLIACDDSIDFDSVLSDTEKESGDANGTVEVWASRFGHELTELKANGTSDGTSIAIVFNPIFNKPVTVDVPSSALTVEELKTEITDAFTTYYEQSYSSYSTLDTSTSAGSQNLFN